jgi:hypothetical protein
MVRLVSSNEVFRINECGGIIDVDGPLPWQLASTNSSFPTKFVGGAFPAEPGAVIAGEAVSDERSLP